MDFPKKITATDCFITAGITSWPLSTHSAVSYAYNPQRANRKYIENYRKIAIWIAVLCEQNIAFVWFPQDILENSKILKVGVESKGDADFLFQDYSIRVESTLDLRYLADLANCMPNGLAKMSEDYLKVKLNKEWRMHTRWNSLTLKPEQIDYAAKDVQVAIELFKFFANKLQVEILQNQTHNIQEFIDKYCALYFNSRYHRRAPPGNSNSAEHSTISYADMWIKLNTDITIFIWYFIADNYFQHKKWIKTK